MEPIRTHASGIYEIYGRDGDEPWKLAPDKLDTSLSLGKGKLGAADWEAGLRDALTTDGEGSRVPVAAIQIAAYKDRWERQDDPPRAQILVLGEDDGKGGYRPTFTVIDGAMWVAAARKAAIPLVPVYVVHPTLPHIEPSAMWLYFNSITNGLAPTERQRAKVLKELAKSARDGRGVTDKDTTDRDLLKRYAQYVTHRLSLSRDDAETQRLKDAHAVKHSKVWVEEYALATATSIDIVTETTKGVFATRRTAQQRKEDEEEAKAAIAAAKAVGKQPDRLISKLANKRGKSKTAIRKALKRAGIDASAGTNGKKNKSDEDTVVKEALGKLKSALNGEAKDATDRIHQIAKELRPLKTAIQGFLDHLERLTVSEDPETPSHAERLGEAAGVWNDALDALWAELLRLAFQLKVHNDYDRAHRDAQILANISAMAAETIRRYDGQVGRPTTPRIAGQVQIL